MNRSSIELRREVEDVIQRGRLLLPEVQYRYLAAVAYNGLTATDLAVLLCPSCPKVRRVQMMIRGIVRRLKSPDAHALVRCASKLTAEQWEVARQHIVGRETLRSTAESLGLTLWRVRTLVTEVREAIAGERRRKATQAQIMRRLHDD